MPFSRSFNVVGVHAAGDVSDVIVGGVLDVPGATMFEKMKYMLHHNDTVRQLLLHEPRGNAAMCGDIILPPCNPLADAGFLIMEHEEYVPMSGSNTIAVTTVLLETGMLDMKEPVTSIMLDTAAGLVQVNAKCREGKVTSAAFLNVPAFVFEMDLPINVPGLGTVKVDIAYGGMIYAIVDAGSVGLTIESARGRELVEVGERIKKAVQDQTNPTHPENEQIRGVTALEFTHPVTSDGKGGKEATNTVVVSPGRLDRSPCGTGTCARMAVMHARGLLSESERFVHRSVIGTEFVGTIEKTCTVGEYNAIVPRIEGSAWITSYKQIVLDRTDPFPNGYRVGDIWQKVECEPLYK